MAYLLWTDDGIAQFLEKYEPDFTPTYRALTWNVERSDVFRVLAVKWIGGIVRLSSRRRSTLADDR